MRRIGYFFLILTLLDFVTILYPPQFFNPTWELQLLGQMVEKVIVPVLGFALVFFCGQQARAKWELPIVKFLAWIAFIYGLVLLLFIPLGIFNTIRIDKQNQKNISAQVNEQIEVVKNASSQVGQVTNTQQMQELLSRLNQNSQAPEIKNTQQVEEIKKELLLSIDVEETNIRARGRETLSNLRFTLLENSIKWILGALISGILLISISKNARNQNT